VNVCAYVRLSVLVNIICYIQDLCCTCVCVSVNCIFLICCLH